MGVLKRKQDNIQILYMFCPVMVKACLSLCVIQKLISVL